MEDEVRRTAPIALRRDAWKRAEQTSRNLLQVIEGDIARNFEVIDLSLRAVVDNLPLVLTLKDTERRLHIVNHEFERVHGIAAAQAIGSSPEELAQEFEPTAQSIRNWVGQSECDAGRGGNGLTTAEREELTQLRRENRQLRLERDILSKAAAWFARETNTIPSKDSSS